MPTIGYHNSHEQFTPSALLAYVRRCGPAITKAAAYTLMAKVARNTMLTLFIRFFSFYSRVAVAGKQIEDKLRANRSIEAAGHA